MITANLAGTSGSHLRPDRNRDSASHSRLNLNDVGLDPETGEKYQNGEAGDETNSESAKRFQNMVHQYRIKRCLSDYKSWGYMACVGIVIVTAIILIILAASGHLNTDGSS